MREKIVTIKQAMACNRGYAMAWLKGKQNIMLVINGNAKKQFLQWVVCEKLINYFEGRDLYFQMFLILEWLQLMGYAISIKTKYMENYYMAEVSFNEGEVSIFSQNSRVEAYLEAIEFCLDDFNSKPE